MPFSVHYNVDYPVSLYAATKKSNELMAHSYSSLFGLHEPNLAGTEKPLTLPPATAPTVSILWCNTPENGKVKNSNPEFPCFCHWNFEISNLFRISIFEFRV